MSNKLSDPSATYHTPAQPAEAELRIKGSRFIGYVAPIADRATAENIVTSRRDQYADATHHCFAWRLGFDTALSALSHDAGEPTGTAGKPILQALAARKITNAICLVTRYFGGVKLGTGGLIRAYGAAAFLAIDAAALVAAFPEAVLRLRYDYALAAAVERVLHKTRGRVISQDFTDHIVCTIKVHRDSAAWVRDELKDACRNLIQIESLAGG